VTVSTSELEDEISGPVDVLLEGMSKKPVEIGVATKELVELG